MDTRSLRFEGSSTDGYKCCFLHEKSHDLWLPSGGLLVLKKLLFFQPELGFLENLAMMIHSLLLLWFPGSKKIGSNKVFEPVKTYSRVVLVC